jgi:hypothetical protein
MLSGKSEDGTHMGHFYCRGGDSAGYSAGEGGGGMMIPYVKAFRLFGILALGVHLAGCDKCGNFYSEGSATPQSCKSDAPQPR